MTLELSNSPGKPDIKTWFGDIVHIHGDCGEIQISMKDFMAATYYVLTNSDLIENDPRLDFLEIMKELVTGPGYSKGANRLLFQGRGDRTFSLAYPGYYPEEFKEEK